MYTVARITSAHKQSVQSGWGISLVLQHEETWYIYILILLQIPPGCDSSPSQGYPQHQVSKSSPQKSFQGFNGNSNPWSLHVVFIAHLVEHCSTNAKAMELNPLTSLQSPENLFVISTVLVTSSFQPHSLWPSSWISFYCQIFILLNSPTSNNPLGVINGLKEIKHHIYHSLAKQQHF